MRSLHQAQKMTVRNDRVRRKADLAHFISLSPTAIPSHASCVYEWRRPGCGLMGPFLEENVSEMPKMFAAYNVATMPTPALVRLDYDWQGKRRFSMELCCDSTQLLSSFWHLHETFLACDAQGQYVSPVAMRSSRTRWTGSIISISLSLHCNPERRTEKCLGLM